MRVLTKTMLLGAYNNIVMRKQSYQVYKLMHMYFYTVVYNVRQFILHNVQYFVIVFTQIRMAVS